MSRMTSAAKKASAAMPRMTMPQAEQSSNASMAEMTKACIEGAGQLAVGSVARRPTVCEELEGST
eukprot:9307080-Alexandrium_andersonii.AAC.1